MRTWPRELSIPDSQRIYTDIEVIINFTGRTAEAVDHASRFPDVTRSASMSAC